VFFGVGLGQVFGDGQGVPDGQVAIDQHRHLAGGRDAGDRGLNCESASKLSKRASTSSNGMPAWRSSTQGRMDQEE
jgi:hypothetical protein